jgi:hypothetical protein
MGKKTLIDQIIEGEPKEILDNLPEPYLFLSDRGNLARLEAAVNIVAVKKGKGYRVVNQSLYGEKVLVLLEKK